MVVEMVYFGKRGKTKERKLQRFLSPQEINVMLDNTINPRDYIIIYTVFHSGLRRNELRNLRIEDIDFINRNIKVVQGKGNKDRYVDIPENLVNKLKEWIGDRNSGWLLQGKQEEGRISNRHLSRIIKTIAMSSNIRKPDEIHFHTIRHSYATFLINNGASLQEVQELLGHQDISTTKIYSHLAREKIKERVDDVFKHSLVR